MGIFIHHHLMLHCRLHKADSGLPAILAVERKITQLKWLPVVSSLRWRIVRVLERRHIAGSNTGDDLQHQR